MNRKKKIAMLAGLLGSLSLSVVQAEISEKPVANKQYNNCILYLECPLRYKLFAIKQRNTNRYKPYSVKK